MLFKGCIGELLDTKTITDAVTVLEASGAAVAAPAGQVCCGALDLHDGQPEAASRFAGVNCQAFDDEATPILTLASGCAATLALYSRLAPREGERFAARLQDILRFVDDGWSRIADRLGPLDMRVAVFEPCSVRNGAPAHSRAKTVLERLPGAEVVELDPGLGCCGAAGHHFVTRPEQADALLAPIVAQIDAIAPDVVVVSNVGCALHIGGAFTARGSGPEVMHPVSLIARSLARLG
jgi:glycolate oxidase iron-sulfur subunit